MQPHKSSKKSIAIIVIIILVALLAYFYYQSTLPVTNSSLQTTAASADAQAVGSRVLSLLNQIRSLKIDNSVFTDPAYQTLRDYSVAIPQEDVGRVNPFAPLPGSQAPAAPASGSKKTTVTAQ